jgi:hypothetical protein
MTYVLIGFVAVLAIVPFFRLLTGISKRLNRRSSAEVADKIEGHIQGTEGPWDWDDFTSVPIADDRLDAIRLRCLELEHALPEERTEELNRIVERLRNEPG